MKANVLEAVNNLVYKNISEPVLKEGEVLVEVKAAGICSSDIPRIFFTGTYSFPLIPGHEFAGVVRKISSEKYEPWLNKAVSVFPLLPCGRCPSCLKGIYETCSNYGYLGSRNNGGFADYVAVPEWNLIELPSDITFEQAAMLEPIAVALHAVKQINLTEESVVAIYGPGTIGILIAQWCRMFGAKKILIVGTREEQSELVKKLGFKHFCNTNKHDPSLWVCENTGGIGSDISIDAVGDAKVLKNCIESTRPCGEILLVGNPNKDFNIDRELYWKILRKQLTMVGTWNSSYNNDGNNDWTEAMKALQNKTIIADELITHKYNFDKLADALEIAKSRSEYYCKMMLVRD